MVDHHPGFSGPAHPELEVHGTETARLPAQPASGQPMSGMALEPDRDYPADTDLCFERGQYADRIRLTAGDLNGLRALLSATDGLEALKATAAGYMRDALGEAGPDAAEWALRNAEMAVAAHAAGYRLSAADRAPGDREAVRDFLLEQAELRAVPGSLVALEQQDALERVIELLGHS